MGVNKTEGSSLVYLKNGGTFSEEINIHEWICNETQAVCYQQFEHYILNNSRRLPTAPLPKEKGWRKQGL